MIKALGYILVSTPKVDEWRTFARDTLGLQADETGQPEYLRLRMDEKSQRLLVRRADAPATLTMGFEVENAGAMAQVAQSLAQAGYAISSGAAAEIEQRCVSDMFHFVDPDGNRVEVAYGLQNASTDFVPSRPTGGFRTGELGMGHVALKAGRFREMCSLYRDVLNFGLSDYARDPFPVEFFHVNARHHTVGIADTGTGPGIYHVMLEYNEWDDVGRALDIALENPDSISVTLGRHSNDHVTSFYVACPDGWLIEMGWGARLIGPDWQVEELQGLSLWGHDRKWLPPEPRERARQQRIRLAALGVRAPMVISHRR